ncbi:hypothetical protein [Nitratireductor sp. ZSWI3]|uniref:hypothetical protein n=1 Tax=Nitratireductor sp. ZSWI3 TaxID=2966359 RepID=UPI00214FD404|nr:hypothetical protein [Nitratireductor sp. ZSWI3]MCR4268348.1 hypothetical protein [Nitratireductor sp. ZSWI3]
MTEKLASLELPDGSLTETTETRMPGSAAERAPHRRSLLPFRAAKPKTQKPPSGSGDWVIMIGGIGLATVCALFPWYIFFNQDEFGVRPLTFEGRPATGGSPGMRLPELVGMRIPQRIIEFPELDYGATGTVGSEPAKALEDQPYPGDFRSFRLVDAANGRAMIEDEDGYWIVQRGSWLPDGSRVARIQRRQGTWEIVTTRDAVIAMAAR